MTRGLYHEIYNSGGGSKSYTLNVTGKGTSKTMPDMFRIKFEIALEHPNYDIVVEEVADKTEKLLKNLKGWVFDDDSVRTISYDVSNYEYEEITGKWRKGEMITTVSTVISVKSKRVDEISELIGIATDSGNAKVRSLSFALSDDLHKSERKKALEDAVEMANFEAFAVSKAMGIQLARPLKIDIPIGNSTSDIYESCIMAKYQRLSDSYDDEDDDDDYYDGPVIIEKGEITTHATVNITYEY